MKYVIDLPDGEQVIFMRKKGMNIIVPKDKEMVVFDEENPLGGVVKLAPYKESSGTAEEAWNFAGRLIGYADDALTVEEIEDCYGTSEPYDILDQLSYEEAKEQYDKWKIQKDEIHIGDELAHNDNEEETVIVTRVLKESEAFDGFGKNGEVLKGYFYGFWHKTGRHFEKVAELLEELKMKGD